LALIGRKNDRCKDSAFLLNLQDEIEKSAKFNQIFGIIAKRRLNIAETFGRIKENAYLCGQKSSRTKIF
jgi:hypothetical protein